MYYGQTIFYGLTYNIIISIICVIILVYIYFKFLQYSY